MQPATEAGRCPLDRRRGWGWDFGFWASRSTDDRGGGNSVIDINLMSISLVFVVKPTEEVAEIPSARRLRNKPRPSRWYLSPEDICKSVQCHHAPSSPCSPCPAFRIYLPSILNHFTSILNEFTYHTGRGLSRLDGLRSLAGHPMRFGDGVRGWCSAAAWRRCSELSGVTRSYSELSGVLRRSSGSEWTRLRGSFTRKNTGFSCISRKMAESIQIHG